MNYSRLSAKNLSVGYSDHFILNDLSVAIPDGSFTAIIGPNGCGKSTLLRTLCRLLSPKIGNVFLDQKPISTYPTAEVAKIIAFLPQRTLPPEGISVGELVARGRFPHQGFFKQWSRTDEMAVLQALTDVKMLDFAEKPISQLSGGQCQRVWVAMALAQETPIMLLDEPTTFLDIAHQIDLMELLCELNKKGRTIVAVLHDLNHASRYANNIIAMKNGKIVASGKPSETLTVELIKTIFDLNSIIIKDPVSDNPFVIPSN